MTAITNAITPSTNTSVAAYSTRAKPDAPISTPLSWTELSPVKLPGRFNISPRLAAAFRVMPGIASVEET